MMARRRKPRSARQVLRLLEAPDFQKGALDILRRMARLAETKPSPQEWEAAAQALVPPFMKRWGVPPPHAGVLLDRDPRRRVVEAIASGRWGIVSIFGWTRDPEVRRAVSRIRRTIGVRHGDAENEHRAQLARWLKDCGIPDAEIARTVWRRSDGLRRPSRSETIRRTPERQEIELLERYRRRGLSDAEAEQAVYKRLRGSEPRATAAVRMAVTRYVGATERLNADLATPLHTDSRSYALTMLLRAVADGNDEQLRHWAKEVKQALLTPADS